MTAKLEHPNTPLQQIKKYAIDRMEELNNRTKLNQYEMDSRDGQLLELELIIDEINKFEVQDQRQASDATFWSWRNGDDMGR